MSKRLLLLVALSTLGCGADNRAVLSATPRARPSGPRIYESQVPASYVAGTRLPLVLLLHGAGSTGRETGSYLGLSTLVDQERFLYASPDGTPDSRGQRFWNATDACCNFEGWDVDDVGYLTSVVDDMSARYGADPRRVFVVGYSNGGFMANRLACDAAARVTAVVSLSGATWYDSARCNPAQPVNVLLVHGDADRTIAYAGGRTPTLYPGARATAASWAAKNRCGGALVPTGRTLDLESSLAGNETDVEATGGCPAGGAVELWTIHGGGHALNLGPAFRTEVWAWLSSHARP